MIKWPFGRKRDKKSGCPKCGEPIPDAYWKAVSKSYSEIDKKWNKSEFKKLDKTFEKINKLSKIKCPKCGNVYDIFGPEELEKVEKELEFTKEDMEEVTKVRKSIEEFAKRGLPLSNISATKLKSDDGEKSVLKFRVELAVGENKSIYFESSEKNELISKLNHILKELKKGKKLTDIFDEMYEKLGDEYFI